MRLRRAQRRDLNACHEIETICFEGHGASLGRIRRRIEAYPEGFIVAERREGEGRIVGFVNSGAFACDDIGDECLKDLVGHDPEGPFLVVFSLVVRPEARGAGIARELLERLVETAIASDKRAVLLSCREHLLGFYGSLGFVETGVSPLRFGGHEWREMRLELGGGAK
jgi:ribosomal protein S18 acetylase RimI-like enzyme